MIIPKRNRGLVRCHHTCKKMANEDMRRSDPSPPNPTATTTAPGIPYSLYRTNLIRGSRVIVSPHRRRVERAAIILALTSLQARSQATVAELGNALVLFLQPARDRSYDSSSDVPIPSRFTPAGIRETGSEAQSDFSAGPALQITKPLQPAGKTQQILSK